MIKKGLGVLFAVLLFAVAVQATDPGTVTTGGGMTVPLSYDIEVHNLAVDAQHNIVQVPATVTLWTGSSQSMVATQYGAAKTGKVVKFTNLSPSTFGVFIVKGSSAGYGPVSTTPFALNGTSKTIMKYLQYNKYVVAPLKK